MIDQHERLGRNRLVVRRADVLVSLGMSLLVLSRSTKLTVPLARKMLASIEWKTIGFPSVRKRTIPCSVSTGGYIVHETTLLI
jgi:hypothetical protein